MPRVTIQRTTPPLENGYLFVKDRKGHSGLKCMSCDYIEWGFDHSLPVECDGCEEKLRVDGYGETLDSKAAKLKYNLIRKVNPNHHEYYFDEYEDCHRCAPTGDIEYERQVYVGLGLRKESPIKKEKDPLKKASLWLEKMKLK